MRKSRTTKSNTTVSIGADSIAEICSAIAKEVIALEQAGWALSSSFSISFRSTGEGPASDFRCTFDARRTERKIEEG